MTSLTAGAVAALVGGEIEGSPDVEVAGVAALDVARPGDLAFLADPRWVPYLDATQASVLLIARRFRTLSGGPTTRILVDDPRAAARQVAAALTPPLPWGVHPTATLERGVRWTGRIAVGAGAWVGTGVRFGGDCVVGPGARVGIAGFSHASGPDGPHDLAGQGRVTIGDRVTIGALVTIAAGGWGPTVIGSGTKLDAQVHVGHHVRIGARCLIMAQVGIAGSTVLGDDVVVAGQAGLADGLHVGDRARVAAQAGVIGDIPAGATVSGFPARDHRQVLRQAAALARLAPHARALEHMVSGQHAPTI